jgi:TonB family protein
MDRINSRLLAILVIAAATLACGLARHDAESIHSQCDAATTGANPVTEHEFTGFPLVRFDPEYPPLAKRYCLSGWVMVSFSISDSGRVSDLRILDSEPNRVFDESALRALEQWRYNPTPSRPPGSQDRACALFRFLFSFGGSPDRQSPSFPSSDCHPDVPVPQRAA